MLRLKHQYAAAASAAAIAKQEEAATNCSLDESADEVRALEARMEVTSSTRDLWDSGSHVAGLVSATESLATAQRNYGEEKRLAVRELPCNV